MTPFATKAVVPAGQGVRAILDGQQRLTALNIAIYGSMAVKKKYAWWNSLDAFPKKRLFLNLLDEPDPEELGLRYELRFLTDEEAVSGDGEPDKWYPLANVMTQAEPGPAMLEEITSRGFDVDQIKTGHQRLWDLYNAFRVTKPINYYQETSQDPDKVLDIFVRVNSGGTTLSYSDLLLSMATNQWEHLDAREEVRSLVNQLNTAGGKAFSFSKDLVLKTALLIAGVDAQFRVSNFTQENMKKVEASWEQTRHALIRAATLVAGFGLTGRTLTADSVLIPIAYYLDRRGVTDGYLSSAADAADRAALRQWLIRSLLKRGIWGSGLDSLLRALSSVIDEKGQQSFPSADLAKEMATYGKSLDFDATEIDELLEMKYGGPKTFSALALLYPGLNFTMEFHEDHIFPRSRFTTKRLGAAGIPADQVVSYQDAVDRLSNLQLLGGIPNIEKQAKEPAVWIDHAFESSSQRDTYLRDNDLEGLPLDLASFLEFSGQRRERMRNRLINLLGIVEAKGAASAEA